MFSNNAATMLSGTALVTHHRHVALFNVLVSFRGWPTVTGHFMVGNLFR